MLLGLVKTEFPEALSIYGKAAKAVGDMPFFLWGV